MSINLHSSTRSKSASFSLKKLSAAVLSALLCSGAYAAGLGKLTVLSSLGQPLRAEIELTSVSKDEAGSIVAKLASVEAYRQANIEFQPTLFSLRFAVENRGDRHFVRVTSTQPINEPFVDMLIELGGTNSRLVREYTFLLDPADLRMGQSAQIAGSQRPAVNTQTRQATAQTAPVPQPAVAEKPVPAARQPQASTARSANRVADVQDVPLTDGGYQVQRGDTLAEIAGQVRPEGVSLDQMLVALYRANTNAFIGNNMNRLRAGQILTVPDADAAKAISRSDARGVIIAQAADFNAYRNKLAEQVGAAAAPKTAEASQSAGGKITTQVEEKATAANEAKDKLKLSNAGAAAKTDAGKATGIAAGAEDMIAKDRALAEANARVKELEKNVTDLQKLLEIKNKDLAEQQKQADLAKQAATTPATPADGANAAPAAANSAAAPAPVTPAENAAAPDADKAAQAPGSESAVTPPADQPAVAEAEKPAPQAAAPVAAKPVPAPVEASLIDDLMDNSILLASLAVGLLAGLGALGFYSNRRKKQSKEFGDSILTDSSLKANSLFGSTGGQSVDTSNSVFNSSFSPAASQLDTNEVDPVAEADVYIAYGRDAQAEEILKEALRTQPERNAVRLKLLEIYSSRKDVRAFETLASELYSLTKGDGEDWAQAAEMGLALDPNNPLYGGAKDGAKSAGADAGKSAALAAPMLTADDSDLDDLLKTATPDETVTPTHGLDTNSGYFSNTMVAAEMPKEEPVQDLDPATESPSANGLDFDLAGFGIQTPAASSADELIKPVADEAEPADLDIGMLDFGLGQQTVAKVTDDADSPPTAMSVELGSDDLSFLSADLPSLDDQTVASHTDAQTDSTSLNFDLSDINLDLNPDEKQAEPAQAMSFDLGDLTPTLGAAQEESAFQLPESAPAFALPQESFESSLDTEADGDHSPESEMATKLDLAIAYQEIGDKDGARELLDEVIKGGSPDQSEKAKSLMVSLA